MVNDTEPALRGIRVLVVEDEYIIAMDITDTLEAGGAVVVGPAATVEDALELLASHDVDAASLDINLDNEKVFPVADALEARGTPFIFTSGYDPKVIPPRYADVLRCAKPVVNHDLVEALLAALRQREAIASDYASGADARGSLSDRS